MDLEELVREFIDKTVHLSLATAKDNRPWVSEVHFAYDEDLNIYWRSLTSRRHSQEIAANPYVSGSIVKQHQPNEPPKGLYFEGRAELLGPGLEQAKAYNCIKNRLVVPDGIFEEAQSPDGHQFYKISVSKFYLFGKFNDQPTQKYELSWPTGMVGK